jgi:hypothetical protein
MSGRDGDLVEQRGVIVAEIRDTPVDRMSIFRGLTPKSSI